MTDISVKTCACGANYTSRACPRCGAKDEWKDAPVKLPPPDHAAVVIECCKAGGLPVP